MEGGQILITGGTSGLGLELVKIFLKEGYNVVAIGRSSIDLPGYERKLSFYAIDFSDLKKTALTIKDICLKHEFDYVVNNAGVLSPPDNTVTKDGLEYTFQVNFLAHLLINEIILRNQAINKSLKICAITSPVYRLAEKESSLLRRTQDYKPFQAYSESKYFLACMCKELYERYPDRKLFCFSFNPGIFNSGIYRMQNSLFRLLYRIAAPFMRDPEKVAEAIAAIMRETSFTKGTVYDIRKRTTSFQDFDPSFADAFWRN
ncbi:MAG: retinol dehydrogenase 12, partial [Bacteroidota bacterium]|nr:retinol dehydrogenase 12 [Bacteroidota bacterium]